MRSVLLINSSVFFNPKTPPSTPPYVKLTRTSSLLPVLASKDSTAPTKPSASQVIRSFYHGINSHNLASVEPLIAHNCVYEDLVFSSPFAGRKAILEFFEKFIGSTSKDLQFVIDDISAEDSFAVGVTWHLEWNGKPFPFSKGCSFYRLDPNKQIIYGRDCVEPAIKPGESVLVILKFLSWLFKTFPRLAD